MAKFKLKTKKAAAKRFKMTATGKLVRNKANKSHILTKKSTKLADHSVPRDVLTVAYMNRYSLAITLAEGRTCFW